MDNIQKLSFALGINLFRDEPEKEEEPENPRREYAYSHGWFENWKALISSNPMEYLETLGVHQELCSCSFQTLNTENPRIKNSAKEVYYWLKGIADNPDNLLLKSENVGCGKTHLAVSSLLQIAKDWDSFSLYKPKMRFFTYSKLVKETLEFIANKELQIGQSWAIDYLIDLDILVLDDLGSEKTSEANVDFLYAVLDGRHSQGKSTIITTNLTEDDIEKRYHKRIHSRITSGKVLELRGGDNRVDKLYQKPFYKGAEQPKQTLVDLTKTFNFHHTSDGFKAKCDSSYTIALNKNQSKN